MHFVRYRLCCGYVAACICLHFYDINEECKKSNMPFVCIFTVVNAILELPQRPRRHLDNETVLRALLDLDLIENKLVQSAVSLAPKLGELTDPHHGESRIYHNTL